jgi:hypothetical protein
MLSSAHQSGVEGYEHPEESKHLVYRFGTSPATWPSLVVHSRVDKVDLYDEFSFHTHVGEGPYYLIIENNLAATLSKYHSAPFTEWIREFIEVVGEGRDILQLYGESKNQRVAEEAERVLEDPAQKPIPWEQAKAELGL